MSNACKLAENCIHCGLCTRKCDFLKKYSMDLQAFAEHPELAYHCFLCSDCSMVCPRKIDGREIALQLRRDAVADNGGKVPEKGYAALIAEKKDYLFRNQKKAGKKSVLFPGCNFPSFFPETTEYLVKLLKETADIGVWYDCCGKPVSELGLIKEENQGLNSLKQRIERLGIEEIVVLCPNCYHFLKPRLDIPVVSIYDKLQELGLGNRIHEEKVNIFVPCPDKASLVLEQSLLPFVDGEYENIKGIQCCGLGGCAAEKEPEISGSFAANLKDRKLPNVYVYCASCAGKLRRSGVANVHHVLVDILGTNEESELSFKSIWNRAKHRIF